MKKSAGRKSRREQINRNKNKWAKEKIKLNSHMNRQAAALIKKKSAQRPKGAMVLESRKVAS